MSREENNNFPIDPALLDNGCISNSPAIFDNEYIPNGPDIVNNDNNNSSSGSDDYWARTSRVLQSARSRNWEMTLGEMNHIKEDNFLKI